MTSMPIHNRDRISQYDIPEDWYANRSLGLSAFIRIKDEERWIGPCVESILDFFDEIVVTIDKGTIDRTVDILASFQSPKIKMFYYPFKINAGIVPEDSVNSGAYYTNWSISKTSFSHVSQWDADMIMLPSFKKYKEFILRKNMLRFSGYDIATPDFKYIAKSDRSDSPRYRRLCDIRIYRVNKHLFYRGNKKLYLSQIKEKPDRCSFQPMCERFTYYSNLIDILDPRLWLKYPHPQLQHIWNVIARKDFAFPKPIYLHTKPLKQHKTWSGKDMTTERGKDIPVEVPSFVFKLPEAYLNED